MRVNLTIIDADSNYVNRISNYLSERYGDQLALYCFSSIKGFEENLKGRKLDVLLVAQSIDLEQKDIPANVAVAYLCDSNDIESYKGIRAVGKYQKMSNFFNDIVKLYAELEQPVIVYRQEDKKRPLLYLVLSPEGGNGASTLAAGCAQNMAARGIRALYLCIQQHGMVEALLDHDLEPDLHNVLTAVKNPKSNLALKLKSLIKTDSSGALTFGSCQSPLDIMGLDPENLERLVDGLGQTGNIDAIILDMDPQFNELLLEAITLSNRVLLIGNGTQTSNAKLVKFCHAIAILDESKQTRNANKLGVVHNKFASKSGVRFQSEAIPVFGGFPRIEAQSPQQVVQRLAAMEQFSGMLAGLEAVHI